MARLILWILLALLIGSTSALIVWGQHYRDIVRITLFWWLPDDVTDHARPGRGVRSGGGPGMS